MPVGEPAAISELDGASPIVFARQPITAMTGRLAGYELLDVRVEEAPLDGSASGAQLALAALTTGQLQSATGGALAYVDVSPAFLRELEALPLAPEDVVLEVPPACLTEPDLVQCLERLHGRGYRLVLDGFDPAVGSRLIESLAGVKVDVRDRAALEAAARLPCPQRVAVGVDDHATRQRCAQLGYTHVQGGVILAPAPDADAGLASGSVARLRLATGMAEDLDAIEVAIRQDVGLSLRLLRYLNSAYFGLRSRISSIRHAVHMLGPRAVRQWATLVVVADIGGAETPLVTIALGRARLCEAIAVRFEQPDPAAYFATGLLSVADALCRRPMAEVIASLPLSDDIVAALLARQGGKGRALRIVELVEAGRAEEAAVPPLAAQTLRALHTAALRWSDLTVGQLASTN